MYLDHFGLNEPPFRITPHTDFFFQGANRGATLEALLYAITNDEGIIRVSGEVGSGKTMLCRVLMERLPGSVETIYLANPSLSRDEILFAIADELKLSMEGGRTTRVLRALQEHLIRLFAEGRRVVVLIDEAHAMPKETLEEIRLLSNLESNRHKLLQIVLFGQPELDQHLNNADMRQLKERITHGFRLEPLVRSDIDTYIDFRMRAAGYRGPKVFAPGAIRLVADASEGLTRRVNILADKALLAAFASGTHAVTETEVKRAVRDSQFYRARINPQKMWFGASTLAAGLVLGWAIHSLYQVDSHTSTESPSLTKRDVAPAAPSPSAGESSLGPVRSVSAAPAVSGEGGAPAKVGGVSVRDAVASPLMNPQSPGPAAPGSKPASASANSGPIPPDDGELVRARFAATQDWLNATPGGRYSIQLVTVNTSQLAQLESFLLKASKAVPADELLVYGVKIDGAQHYRAAYGSYATAADALAAMKELPTWIKEQQPYYRSVERMRSQNRH
jgi:type II secretory pathway predicted ATPase ExeA